MLKKVLFLLCFSLAFWSCNPEKQPINPELINGYWEITEVAFSNGMAKPYTVNTTVDYIELKGARGFIKKMKPNLSGRYQTSNKAAFFTVQQKNAQWVMHFEGNHKSNLRIQYLDSVSYGVLDEQNTLYRYKRFIPIQISNE